MCQGYVYNNIYLRLIHFTIEDQLIEFKLTQLEIRFLQK